MTSPNKGHKTDEYRNEKSRQRNKRTLESAALGILATRGGQILHFVMLYNFLLGPGRTGLTGTCV